MKKTTTQWKDKPTGDGYYWYRKEDEKDRICKVYDIRIGDAMVSWIGNDWDDELNSVEGEWYGPLQSPR